MFAPPPLQFSREEIERLKLEYAAKLEEEKRKSVASGKSGKSGKSGSEKSAKSPTSPRSFDSSSSKSRKKFFARSSKSKVVRSSLQDVETSPTGRKQSSDVAVPEEGEREGRVERAALPASFGEKPRKAPEPPPRRKPVRPFEDSYSSPRIPVSARYPPKPITPPPAPPPGKTPPPIPERSPRRQSANLDPPRKLTATGASIDAALSDALAQLSTQGDVVPTQTEKATALPQVRVAPLETGWINGFESPVVKPIMIRPPRTLPGDMPIKPRPASRELKSHSPARAPAVQGAKVDKSLRKSASLAATREATAVKLEEPEMAPVRRATEPAVEPMRDSWVPGMPQGPWKRRKKGETMSQLLDAGFFPSQEDLTVIPDKKYVQQHIHVRLPPPLAMIDKALPATPGSVSGTPTEVFLGSPRRVLPPGPGVSKKRRTKKVRSPLSQIAVTDPRANFNDFPAGALPGRLASIPETVHSTENSPPPSSGMTTPIATQIHLRGGSVVTVTPPEFTAWQRHAYIPGPIKLLTPMIMPRNDSLANLEPFQEAIDKVYQHALAVPRRRSDDAAVEDICEWFDDFGFADVEYQGDTMLIENIMLEDLEEMDGEDVEDNSAMERFSTPPLEATVSPVEMMIAKEIVDSTRRESIPIPPIPPPETEESLRARGFARLSQMSTASDRSRRPSRASGRKASIVSFAPQPEQTMLSPLTRTTTETSRRSSRNPSIGRSSSDYNDDVVEMDLQSGWVAPAADGKKDVSHKGSPTDGKLQRSPMAKMRGFMKSAVN
ncbi:hypothetical protein LTR86_005343 [Recurvomyces mirabilis]|nr:hypothetical protein LTR86_005343 [Recurvomyces mirabilis]